MARKSDTLTIRLTPETRALLDKAQSTLPYCPTITSIVERGITLAIKEMNAMASVLDEKDTRK